MAPELRRRGLLFVGLDVIGDYLTEINVTSPTCVRELDAQFGLNIAGQLFDVIERHASRKPCRVSATCCPHLAPTRSAPPCCSRCCCTACWCSASPSISSKPKPSLPTLDVTLVNVANREAPDKADFLAQANNRGGGESDQAARPSQLFSGPMPKPDPGRRAATGGGQPRRGHSEATADKHGHHDRRQPTSPSAATPRKLESTPQDLPEPPSELSDAGRRWPSWPPNCANAARQYAKRPKKKYISANTKEYAYAAYMRGWVDRVERVGNLNYPDEARRARSARRRAADRGAQPRRQHQEHRGGPAVRGSRCWTPPPNASCAWPRHFPALPTDKDHIDELNITRTWQFHAQRHPAQTRLRLFTTPRNLAAPMHG